MKPMIILPPGQMSKQDIDKLQANDIVVVIAKNPAAVKFVDPIPSASSRTQIENAAIQLSRILLNGQVTGSNITNYRSDIAKLYVDILIEGTSLDRNGSKEEQESRIFDLEKADELRRLARAEAKAERTAAKAKKNVPKTNLGANSGT